MSEQQLKDNQKKDLQNKPDRLLIYIEQIKQKAFELQYGSLHVEFKIYNGQIENGKITRKEENLRPS